jgi:hypothetical protein
MRRQSTRTPAIVSIRADRTDREINVNERSGVIQEFALVSEDPCKTADRELERRADIRFATVPWVVMIVSAVFRTVKFLANENPIEPTRSTARTGNSTFSRKTTPTEKPSAVSAMVEYPIQGPCRSYRSAVPVFFRTDARHQASHSLKCRRAQFPGLAFSFSQAPGTYLRAALPI